MLIIGLPLVGSIWAGCFGRWIGEKGSVTISTSMVGVASILSWYGFYEVGICGNKVSWKIGRWIESDLLNADWGFKIDSLTVMMLILVTTVSTLVHIYSMEYMLEDGHRSRFFSYLSLFTFFMIVLVTSDNYLGLFLGWEGIGVCSYLLINFWYIRLEANKAAIQAMIVNRIGDVGLALGIILIYIECRSLEYDTVMSLGSEIGMSDRGGVIMLIGILLFIGAVGKSAQFGLHVWLPFAMEGPSPVSALIHAATLVTAGVYLIARSSPLLEYSSEVLWIIAIVGGMTAIFAATTGLVQNDLKRVIAYSTASQLGYMVFACGLSGYAVGVFHLVNHGFFKALLFLSAGSVIHGIADEQDLRKMGGLGRVLPYTYSMLMIGSLALMGFPFLTGFYSKDVILEIAYAKGELGGFGGVWTYCVGSIGAFFTAYYSMRLLHLTFLSKAGGNRTTMEGAHEGNWRITAPLFVLSLGSIWIGFILKDMVIGVGTDFWGTAVFVHPENQVMVEAEFLPTGIKWIPVIFSISGCGLAWIIFTYNKEGLYRFKMSSVGRRLYKFLNRRWYFDKVYSDIIIQGMMGISYHVTYKGIDKGVLELFGPKGVSSNLIKAGRVQSVMQSGNIYNYMFVMIVGIVFLLTQ